MNYFLDYAAGGVTPKALYLDADRVAEVIATSRAIDKSKVWDSLYSCARTYGVFNGTNYTWVSPENVESIIKAMRSKIQDPADSSDFEIVVTPLLSLCADLRDNQRRSCQWLMANITNFNNTGKL